MSFDLHAVACIARALTRGVGPKMCSLFTASTVQLTSTDLTAVSGRGTADTSTAAMMNVTMIEVDSSTMIYCIVRDD